MAGQPRRAMAQASIQGPAVMVRWPAVLRGSALRASHLRMTAGLISSNPPAPRRSMPANNQASREATMLRFLPSLFAGLLLASAAAAQTQPAAPAPAAPAAPTPPTFATTKIDGT